MQHFVNHNPIDGEFSGGWTIKEIDAEVERMVLAEPENEELIRRIAKEAREKGNSWPLWPKPVPRPALHN